MSLDGRLIGAERLARSDEQHAAATGPDDPAAEFYGLDYSDDDGGGGGDGGGAGDGAGGRASEAARLEPWRVAVRRTLGGGDGSEPALPCQILPHLLLGDLASAACLPALVRLGVTHVLNAAGDEARGAATDAYARHGMRYLQLGAMDVVGYEMGRHWTAAGPFIRAAREAGGRCLVHCAAGINRSGFVAATELLLHSRLAVLEAVTRLRAARGVVLLNEGFQRQLIEIARDHNLLGATPPLDHTQCHDPRARHPSSLH